MYSSVVRSLSLLLYDDNLFSPVGARLLYVIIYFTMDFILLAIYFPRVFLWNNCVALFRAYDRFDGMLSRRSK